jgi:hypothetical protein
MIIRITIICLLIAVLFGYSCRKDECHIDQNRFSIGDFNRCEILYHKFDPALEVSPSGYGSVDETIDITGDDIDDIKLISSTRRWAWEGYSFIDNLNDSLEYAINRVDDTILYCFVHDTINPVQYNAKSGYQCSGSGTDSIVEIRKDPIPVPFNYGDEINFDDLQFGWESYGTLGWYAEGEFYYPEGLWYHYRFGNWSKQGPKYLLFRIKNGSVIKFGWILIQIENYRSITLYEYGIQK